MTRPAGILYVVATPIGNRGDLSPRAVETLRQVNLVAAEDTRNSGQLLRHFQISTPLVSLHAHNERTAIPGLIEKLQSGCSVALISDAGTPAISDPGSALVDAALMLGIVVLPVPGPSAVTALMSVSGFAPGPFLFYGFLPAKSGARGDALDRLRPLPFTLVFYEAPHRIRACLKDLAHHLGGERQVVIGRELTKVFETVHRCTLAEAIPWMVEDPNRERGEFVLAVSGAIHSIEADPARHDRLLRLLMEKMPAGEASSLAASITGESRGPLYQRVLALKERDPDHEP